MSEMVDKTAEADPAEQVAIFLDANALYAESLLVAYEGPSTDALHLAHEYKKNAVITMGPLVDANFFADPFDRELADLTVGTVMEAITRLFRVASAIRPDEPLSIDFSDEAKEQSVDSLVQGANEEGHHPVVANLANLYEQAVSDSYEKLMTADIVIDFGLRLGNRQERMKQIKNFGIVAAAALLGTGLANYWDQRKRNQA